MSIRKIKELIDKYEEAWGRFAGDGDYMSAVSCRNFCLQLKEAIKPEWNPVDSPPDCNRDVWVLCENGDRVIGWFSSSTKMFRDQDGHLINGAVQWCEQYIPEPPDA